MAAELVRLFSTTREVDGFYPRIGNTGILELSVDSYVLREVWHAFSNKTPISLISQVMQKEYVDCVIERLNIRSTFASDKVFIRADLEYGSEAGTPWLPEYDAVDTSVLKWEDIELEINPEPSPEVCDFSLESRWSVSSPKPIVAGMFFFDDATPPVNRSDEFALRIAFGSAVEFKVRKAVWSCRASYAPEPLSRGDWEVA